MLLKGYTENFVECVKKFKKNFLIVIIASNVVTAEMTEQLLLAGADIIKVGIGPGSVCLIQISDCGIPTIISSYGAQMRLMGLGDI